MRAVLGHAAHDHRDVAGIADIHAGQRRSQLRRRHDGLGRDAEGEIEIHRVDHVDLRALLEGLADALVQQRHFMADVGADDDDGVGRFDLGHRHAERFRGGAVGQVELADAVVDVAAAQPRCQARQQRALLVRGGRMGEHAKRVAGVVAQYLRGQRQRFFPAGFAEAFATIPFTDPDQRHAGAVGGGQAFMRVAVAVGQPALVHRLVVARHAAQQVAAADVMEQVAAQRVVVAQRRPRGQLPRARLEAEHLVGQRAHRADVDDVAGQLGGQRLAVVGADLQVLTAVHAAQLVGAGDFRGHPDAARAVDAAGHLAGDQWAQVFVRHRTLALDEAIDRAAVAQRQILQLAFAALVADWAVQRVVDQQELHHVALRLQRLVVAREDLHAVHHRRGAGRRRLRRGAAADFRIHQAHAAVGGDRQLLVVAETRDRDAGLGGGLDDHRALGRGHLDAVDEDGDVVRRQVRIDGLCAHATTFSALTSVPARSSST